MPAEPRPFPAFRVVDQSMGRVAVDLSDGTTVEFQVELVSSPLDLIGGVEHPDFQAFLAVLLWLRSRGKSLDEVFADPDDIAAYMAARWTPIEVTDGN